jgi:hypothetical protein
MHSKFGSEYLKERGKLEDEGVDGRIILKLTLKDQDMKAWTGFLWLSIEKIGGYSEHVNGPTNSTNAGSLTSWVTISFPKKILPHGSSSSVS